MLSFYGQDPFGNDVIRGYSATHLPTVPGKCAFLSDFYTFFVPQIRIKRKCPLFLPQGSTLLQRLIGVFTGRRVEFADPRILAMAESRDGWFVEQNWTEKYYKLK